MDILNLKVHPREAVGNGPARVLRSAEKIPAVLYGPNTEPLKLAVDKLELEPVFKAGAASQKLFNLQIEGADGDRKVMIKEMQRHPVSRHLLHMDFYEVSMDQKLKVMVPVVTTGNSVGVKMGGMLQIIRRELEVFSLPDRIPESITIDITDLEIGDSFHVEDLQLEGDVEIPAEVNFTILTVLSPMAEEAEAAQEAEEGDLEEGEEGGQAAEGTGETPAEP